MAKVSEKKWWLGKLKDQTRGLEPPKELCDLLFRLGRTPVRAARLVLQLTIVQPQDWYGRIRELEAEWDQAEASEQEDSYEKRLARNITGQGDLREAALANE